MAKLQSQEILNLSEDSGKQLLLFKIGENNFAVNVGDITEIIEIIDIINIPHMNETVPGIINLRGNIIPVIDLKHHLFQSHIEYTSNSRIIIFSIEQDGITSLVGALVDSVMDVLNLSKDDIKSAPDFGTKIKKSYINSAAQLDDSIVIILNIEKVLHHEELSDLKDSEIDSNIMDSFESNDFNIEVSNDNAEIENEIEYVTFLIDDEIYGIKTTAVIEIIGIEEFRKVPNSLNFLKGVVNLRGEIVPIVDVRSRCGLQEKEYTKKTSILIVSLDDKNIGLVVEKLNDVMKFPESKIQDIPSYSATIDRNFIENMADIDGKIIIFIDVKKVLSPDEVESLKNMDIK